MAGLFITFEGIDGSGKSTQLKRCAAAFQDEIFQTEALPRDPDSARAREILVTRNPGGMPFGQELREILLHYPGQINPMSELLLFIADRAQHMSEVVFPALAQNKIILCDRHLDSTKAYQGYGRGLDLSFIDALNDKAIQGRKPDLTFLFDGDPVELFKRVDTRGKADRMESEKLAFYEKVRAGYLAIAAAEPDRVVVLDALQPIEVLTQQVQEKINAIL